MNVSEESSFSEDGDEEYNPQKSKENVKKNKKVAGINRQNRVSLNSMKSKKTFSEFKKEQSKYNPPRSLKPPTTKKQLIPPGSYDFGRHNSLGSLSKEAYEQRLKQYPQHRRMGPTTSALVRPAPPFSRPPPGAALRVMPPKKRIKLEDDDDDKNDEEEKKISKRTDYKIDKPQDVVRAPSPKIERKYLRKSDLTNKTMKKAHSQIVTKSKKFLQKSRASTRTNSPVHHVLVKKQEETYHGLKFKRIKKGSLVDQLRKDGKDTKLDLMNSDSFLSSIQLKDCINESTFKSLPPIYQYQLLMLLPEVDKKTGNDGGLRLCEQALTNEFFTRACQEFKDKLVDGDFNSDLIQRAKTEVNAQTKFDPWKTKFFEPVYGMSTLPEKKPASLIKPVESSWVTFLKFSENSTEEYEAAFKDIQAEVKRLADEESKRLKENKHVSPLKDQSPSRVRTPIRSPLTLKGKRPEDFIKSRRALKRAQLVQRKKTQVGSVQLKDAKARLVEEARVRSKDEEAVTLSSVKEAIRKASATDFLSRSGISTCLPTNDRVNKTPIKKEPQITSYEPVKLSDNSCVKIAIKPTLSTPQTADNNKPAPVARSKYTRGKPLIGRFKSENTRILLGPSKFATDGEGRCSCSLEAMVECRQCGSFWHSDRLNNDSRCFTCCTT